MFSNWEQYMKMNMKFTEYKIYNVVVKFEDF